MCSYYLVHSDDNDQIMTAYRTAIQTLVSLLDPSLTAADAAAMASVVINLETQLANVTHTSLFLSSSPGFFVFFVVSLFRLFVYLSLSSLLSAHCFP